MANLAGFNHLQQQIGGNFPFHHSLRRVARDDDGAVESIAEHALILLCGRRERGIIPP
jgi:hypothetical protein